MSSESYSIKYSPDAANVPHWLIFKNDLGYPSRLLAVAILAHQQAGAAPTREMLAGDFGVNTRTVDRWLDELRAAELLATHRHTRQHLFGVLEPRKPRESIHVSTVDNMINVGSSINVDKLINVDHVVDSRRSHAKAPNAARVDTCVDSRAGGGGDHDSNLDSPPTTAPRRAISPHEITGETGRWMVAEGFSLTKAHQHQHLPLKAAQADYQRRRQLGQRHGAIATAWEVAPPAGDLAAPLEPSAGEFSFSEAEKERYRAMGFAFGSESEGL